MNHPPSKPNLLEGMKRHAGSILFTSAIVAIALLVGAAVLRAVGSTADRPDHACNAVAEALVYLGLSCATCGVAAGLLSVISVHRELTAGVKRMEETLREGPAPVAHSGPSDVSTEAERTHVGLETSGASPSNDDGGSREIIHLLQEIRDNSLLSEDERRERRLRQVELEIDRVAELIKARIENGEYRQAHQAAQNLARRFPREARVANMVREVESARVQGEADQISQVTKQVNDLISISAWVRARRLAQQLQEQYPDSSAARQLVVRVEREHGIAEAEQQRRMYAEVQRFVSRRRWEEALVAARTFIERFGGTPDAEAVRMQIPTLEQNAEIEVRQQLEAEIMELTRHGRYIEALDLARSLVQKFPDSPQAEALRPQLSRLEELANNPDAPPARVRLE